MGYRLGIDLGTTWTAAAVSRRSGDCWAEPEVVALGDRASAVPSVLYLGPDGSVVVGEAAQRRAVTDPGRVVREFKRRVGDPTPLVVAGAPFAAEELCARLVRWVVDRVAEREGGPAARVAVTHPASWGPHKLESLGRALAGQGVPVTFLAEPQAAALHYAGAERVAPGSTIAVYDLGGGTFDAAVVHKAPSGIFELRGRAEGLERLGGVDFDDVVFEHVRAAEPAAFDGLDPGDPGVLAAVARVRRECTEAKEALSADTEVTIPVLLPGAGGTGVSTSVRLHRSEFEALIRDRLEETVAALRRAVASAELTPAELTAVLLVGGSSRIPLVAQLVSEHLAQPVAVDADPKNAIAKGAVLALMPRTPATGTSRSWPGAAAAGGAHQGAAGALVAGGPVTGGSAALRPPPAGAAGGGERVDEGATDVHATLSAAVPPPPRPPAPAFAGPGDDGYHADYDGYDDADYDEPADDRRAAPAVLVTVGGIVAAAAVLGAVFLWPASDTADALGGIGQDVLPVAPSEPAAPTLEITPDAAPEPEPAPEPAPEPELPSEPLPPPTSAAPAPTTAAPPPPPSPEPEPEPTDPPPPTTTVPTPPTDPPAEGSGSGQPQPSA